MKIKCMSLPSAQIRTRAKLVQPVRSSMKHVKKTQAKTKMSCSQDASSIMLRTFQNISEQYVKNCLGTTLLPGYIVCLCLSQILVPCSGWGTQRLRCRRLQSVIQSGSGALQAPTNGPVFSWKQQRTSMDHSGWRNACADGDGPYLPPLVVLVVRKVHLDLMPLKPQSHLINKQFP